jgi:hypothetical protein
MNTKLTAIENGTIPAKTVTFGDGGSLQIVQSKDSLITELDLNNDSSTDTVLEITRSTDNGTTTTSLVKLSNAGALKVKTVEADNIFSKTTFAGFDIAVSDWVSSDSQWYYSKTLSGLDTSKDYFPIVLYSKDSTEIASIADATRAYITSGVLYIWAMAKPSTALTVSKLYAIEA